MYQKNYYVSDVFFKLVFGQNDIDSRSLRSFLLRNIIPDVPISDLSVSNPELTPAMIRMKNNILDIHMQNNLYELDMEMQNSKMTIYLNRRFIHYSCRLIDYQLDAGDTSGKLKELIQIIFIRDTNERCPKLMDDFYAKNQENLSQLGYLQTTIYVYLPYINEIAKTKEKLNEFEALLYLIENGNLENIKYEEKEGVITKMKKKYEKFMKNKAMVKDVDERYQVQVDFQQWHDYDVEYAKKEGLGKGKLETALLQYQIKYQQSGEWIKECTLEQLDYLSQLIITDISSQELKEKVLKRKVYEK